MESSSHVSCVQPVSENVSTEVSVLEQSTLEELLQPWSVLAHLEASLVSFLLAIDLDLSELSSVLLAEQWSAVCSVEIVPVKSVSVGEKLLKQGIALSWAGVISQVVEVVRAVEAVILVQQALWDDVKVVQSLWESGEDVEVPVGGTVSNHESLKVDKEAFSSDVMLHVVLIDLPGHPWNVDSSVTLS